MRKLNPLESTPLPGRGRFYDSGTAGPTVVLLHGTFGSTAGNFGLIFYELSKNFRVVGLDFYDPGAPEEQLHAAHLVDQVRDLFTALELPRAHVLGYSLGAVVAAAFAGTHPDLVDRLVLLSGWQLTDVHQRLRGQVWRALRASDDDALRAFTTISALDPAFVTTMPPAALKASLRNLRFDAFGDKQMDLNGRVDIRCEVSRITAPTLVLSCDRDVMVPPHHQRQLAAAIPGAQLVTLDGGHGIVFEDPDAVSEEVTRFLGAGATGL